MCMCVSVSVCMCTTCMQIPEETEEDIGFPEIGVAGICEPSDICAENQPDVLCLNC